MAKFRRVYEVKLLDWTKQHLQQHLILAPDERAVWRRIAQKTRLSTFEGTPATIEHLPSEDARTLASCHPGLMVDAVNEEGELTGNDFPRWVEEACR